MDTARYAELFLTESQDNLSAINHALLELERTPTAQEPVGALFRAVHTVKGMSATMGYAKVAELSHELETLLDLVRRGEREVTTPLMDMLFSAADSLEQAVELSVAGQADALDVGPMIAALRATASTPAPARSAAAAAPSGDGPKRRKKRPAVKAPRDEPPVSIVVALEPNTPMPGVRAYVALERAKTLGTVVHTEPAPEAFDRDGFDGRLTIGILTGASDEDIDRVVRSAGYIGRVAVRRAGAGQTPDTGAPNGNGGAPSRAGGRASSCLRASIATSASISIASTR